MDNQNKEKEDKDKQEQNKHVINIACNHASINIDDDGGPFGCIIIDEDGFVIGTGVNRVVKNKDPTAHAEIIAIRNACKYVFSHSLEKCKLYSSCEPCPMCLSAIYWSGIKDVYYGSTREDAKKMGFIDEFIFNQLELQVEKRSINMQYIRGDSVDNDIIEKWNNKINKNPY